MTIDGMEQAPTLVMSNELHRLYELLQAEVGVLIYRFEEYEALFGKSKERIGMLNEAAPVFFSTLFDVLWADLLLRLAWITGPAQTRLRSGTNENLSLRRLPALVNGSATHDVQTAVSKATSAAAFASAPRNKIYAHRDLKTALDPDASEITLGSRTQMRQAIGAVEAVLHAVARAYGQRPAVFLPHLGWGVAEDLMELLERGLKAQQQEIAARMDEESGSAA